MKQVIKGGITRLANLLGPHRRTASKPRLWILTYHRILPPDDPRFGSEEPGMIVSPETFRNHLRQLKSLFSMVSMSEWCARVAASKPVPTNGCAITFDDGWRDNFEYALPILREEQVPATLFAVSHMIGTNRQFWPNRLANLLSALPTGTRVEWLERFGFNATALHDTNAIAALILRCKELGDDTLHTLIDETEARHGLTPPAQPVLMDWDELLAMQNSGLVEIGSHTCNHFRLIDNLPLPLVATEIRDSKQLLEERLGREVSTFCYPNGIATPQAIELVAQTYRSAVTTDRGINNAGTNPHALRRVLVHEDVSDTPAKLGARLSGWL